jgi:hypothetical protein
MFSIGIIAIISTIVTITRFTLAGQASAATDGSGVIILGAGTEDGMGDGT